MEHDKAPSKASHGYRKKVDKKLNEIEYFHTSEKRRFFDRIPMKRH